MERLDKILAGTGRWSRKEARELIRAGRVAVTERPPPPRRGSTTPPLPLQWTESR